MKTYQSRHRALDVSQIGREIMKRLWQCLIIFLCCLSAFAGTVNLAWDAVDGAASYRLYTSLELPVSRTNSIRFDTTNTIVSVDHPGATLLHFAVSAIGANHAESDLSTNLSVRFLAVPTNLLTVSVERIIDLSTTNKSELFRVSIKNN